VSDDYNFPVIFWGEDNSTKVQFHVSDKMPHGDIVTAMCAIVKDGCLLMVKPRRGWGLPGGHIEPGETPEQCAIRECKEEASVIVKNLKLIGYWETKKIKSLESNQKYPNKGYQLLYISNNAEVLPFSATHESSARKYIPFAKVGQYHPRYQDFKEVLHYIINTYEQTA